MGCVLCCKKDKHAILNEYNTLVERFTAKLGACNADAWGCPRFNAEMATSDIEKSRCGNKFLDSELAQTHRGCRCPAMLLFDEIRDALPKCFNHIGEHPHVKFYMRYINLCYFGDPAGGDSRYTRHAFPLEFTTDANIPDDLREIIRRTNEKEIRLSFTSAPPLQYSSANRRLINPYVNPATYNNLTSICTAPKKA